ncbi:MAG: hypothetical protein K2F99_02455 [Muribaculaceae bacterium]|nr:hypothetical protein [Muribaculaceae bacterium]
MGAILDMLRFWKKGVQTAEALEEMETGRPVDHTPPIRVVRIDPCSYYGKSDERRRQLMQELEKSMRKHLAEKGNYVPTREELYKLAKRSHLLYYINGEWFEISKEDIDMEKYFSDEGKTPEQIRQEMIDNLQKGGAEALQEIAIPGIRQDVAVPEK